MGLLGGFLCLFLWLLGDTIAILVVFVGMYGFAASNINALPASAVGQITPDGSLGARIGAFYSVIAVASLVGTPIGGALITDKNTKDGYRWLIVFSVSNSDRRWHSNIDTNQSLGCIPYHRFPLHACKPIAA
jgi:MCP family monocarboxylic acid transporter-like MFS transporter 10